MSKNRVIGNNGDIPWHLSSDLKRFKELTLNHPIVMGRKTFESIGRALPKRLNVVISRNKGRCKEFEQKGAICVPTLARAREILKDRWDETFVIGGGEIYKEFLDEADTVYLTVVDTTVDGDAYFPELPDHFKLESTEHCNDEIAYEFRVYRSERDNL